MSGVSFAGIHSSEDFVRAIEAIPLDTYQNAKHVVFNSSTLREIPSGLHQLCPCLERLYIHNHNAVETLPRDLYKLTALYHINASCNQLRRLPSSLSRMTWLTSINLVGNSRIPNGLAQYSYVPHMTGSLISQIGDYYGPIEQRERLAVAAIMRFVRTRSVPDIARMIGQMVWRCYCIGERVLLEPKRIKTK